MQRILCKHAAALLGAMLLLGAALSSCNKVDLEGTRNVQASFKCAVTAPNAAGDEPYDFIQAGFAGYASSYKDLGAAQMSVSAPGTMSGSFKVHTFAANFWCYSLAARGETPAVSIPSKYTKTATASSSDVDGMIFCSETVSLEGDGPFQGVIRPLTGAVVLDILDSKGKWTGKPFSAVTMTAAGGKALAGDITLCLQEARVGELANAASAISFDCQGLAVGGADAPTGLGAVVLPCEFTGTVTIEAESFSASLSIDQPLYLQAGYVKHILVDLAMADVESKIVKHFPYRLGILGDSISTFGGIIPSDHRAYYPTTNSVCADVDDWKKTYWGHLINDYWHCELDVNSSWSGSCVAADPRTGSSYRKPFVDRLTLFQNPDAIILFGGTNDANTKNQVGLGEFNYDQPLDQMNTYCRFRDAYIFVIRTLQAKFPEAQIICILGNHIEGDYGVSVKEIAAHFGLPLIDFRGDAQVTVYSELHPNAAGHAHMAQRIYEETLNLFQ